MQPSKHTVISWVPRLYTELRRALKFAQPRPRGAQAEATELLHEAYGRIVSKYPAMRFGRDELIALVKAIGRHAVADEYRRRNAKKRSGLLKRVTLAAAELLSHRRTDDGPRDLELRELLLKACGGYPEARRMVELLEQGETVFSIAEALKITQSQVERRIRFVQLNFNALLRAQHR